MRVTSDKAKQLAREMLNELYQNAKPKITWEKYVKRYGGTKIRGYEQHVIAEEKGIEILEKYKKKVGRLWRNSLSMLWFDYCPVYYRLEK